MLIRIIINYTILGLILYTVYDDFSNEDEKISHESHYGGFIIGIICEFCRIILLKKKNY